LLETLQVYITAAVIQDLVEPCRLHDVFFPRDWFR